VPTDDGEEHEHGWLHLLTCVQASWTDSTRVASLAASAANPLHMRA